MPGIVVTCRLRVDNSRRHFRHTRLDKIECRSEFIGKSFAQDVGFAPNPVEPFLHLMQRFAVPVVGIRKLIDDCAQQILQFVSTGRTCGIGSAFESGTAFFGERL